MVDRVGCEGAVVVRTNGTEVFVYCADVLVVVADEKVKLRVD